MQYQFSLMLALLGFFTQITPSFAQHSMNCPDPKQIQQQGLSSASVDQQNYVASQQSQYGTSSDWLFAIGAVQASSKLEAIDRAKPALADLSSMGDAIYSEANHVWVCVYNAKDPMSHVSYMGVAISPIPRNVPLENVFTII